MDDAFMRAINPSVPLRDLEAGVVIVIIGIAAAHLLALPTLFASAPRRATLLLGASLAGLGLACVLVANRPPSFLGVTLAYGLGFSALCFVLGWQASAAARRAAFLASCVLMVTVPVVYMLTFSAR